jgi:uncharacterized protein with FMN-binding domain
MKTTSIILTIMFLICAVSPGPSYGQKARYADGTYEGEHSFVKVRVVVRGGNIYDIEMLHHGGGGEEYAEMVKPLLSIMVKKQSTDVDSITGATVSSNHLKKAVNNALQKAAR